MRVSKNISLLIVVAVAAAFTAANASADLITYTYDFDRCTADQKLVGNDNESWILQQGFTTNNTTVLSGSTLWSGNYISAALDGTNSPDSTAVRPNNSGWSFTLLPNTDFECSAMFKVGAANSSTGYMAHFGLGNFDTTTNKITDYIYFGAQYDRLRWSVPGISSNLYYTHGISDTTGTGGKIFNVGVEMEALGSNQYTMKPFYKDMSIEGGERQYFATTQVITVDASQWDCLYARTYTKYTSTKSYLACIDTFSLTTTNPVPEPGTLALLAAGLVGMIAYAWRKRK